MRVSADGGGELPPVGPKLDGVDLMPYLRGETQGEPHETLFWREGYHQAVQHRGWKLICSDLPAGAKWLFNLIEDPTEQVNLAARLPSGVAELDALLDAHNAEQVDPLWPSIVQGP